MPEIATSDWRRHRSACHLPICLPRNLLTDAWRNALTPAARQSLLAFLKSL